MLEELQVPYEIKSFRFDEIKEKPFIDINPNGRVPGRFTLDMQQCTHWLELMLIPF